MLEGGVGALATASGMAATAIAMLTLVSGGDGIVSSQHLYGGTHNQFSLQLPRFGVDVRFVDPHDLDAVRAAIDERTRVLYAETIGNPRIDVLDIAGWAQIAEDAGLPLVIDNTFATPVPVPAVRARRAHRRALGHQVHRRSRHVDRRRDRRLGALRLGARALPGRDRALARLSRHALLRDVRQLRVHHQGARRDDARLRPGALAVQRLPAAAGPRDAVAAHAPARRERARAGRVPARAPARALRQLPRRARTRPTTRPRSATCRSGRARSSRSASRAGARRAGASSRPASCARTSPTSATRRRS